MVKCHAQLYGDVQKDDAQNDKMTKDDAQK